MQTFVALLRGVNVGGHNKLPMADLRSLCESNGLKDVRTYIQSGNIVFRSKKKASTMEAEIAGGIQKRFGFAPKILVLPADEIRKAADSYPFPTDNHKFSHIMFLDAQPGDEAVRKIESMEQGPDKVTVGDRAVFMYFPNGVLGSRLELNKIERILGVHCTSRNWRTVQKLIEMSS